MRVPRFALLFTALLLHSGGSSAPVFAQTAGGGTIAGPLGSRLDSALRALSHRGFSGVVRIEKDGAIILEHGYGLANRADQIPFDPRTVVQIGSNTKDFTAVALLQLRQRGRLALTDSIGKYFPNVPADKRGITIQQIMDHRAGFPIGLGGDFDDVTRTQLIARAMAHALNFPPGTDESYSNTGYSLLAAIIEQVSGTSYDEYVRAHILAPIGLMNTGLLLPHFDPRRVAHGYDKGQDNGTMLSKPHAADGPNWNLRGNGGMVSTVDDMHAFYAALFTGDVLLPPAAARLRFPPDQPVGLAGSDLVSFFLFERLPRDHVELILALNSSDIAPREVRKAIGDILGLPSPDDGPRDMTPAAPRPNAHSPSAAVAATLDGFVRAFNTGDSATLRRFFVDHFVADPAAPPAAERAQRMVGMHEDLGALTISGMDEVEPGVVEILLMSANHGRTTIRARIQAATPDRIVGLQVMVGG